MGKNKKIILVIVIMVLLIGSIGIVCTSGVEENISEKKIVVEYYYFNPCRSCTDGEEYKAELEEEISSFVSDEDYEIKLYNTSNNDYNKRFLELTENLQIEEGKIADVPMVKVNNYYIFGVEAIAEKVVNVIRTISQQ